MRLTIAITLIALSCSAQAKDWQPPKGLKLIRDVDGFKVYELPPDQSPVKPPAQPPPVTGFTSCSGLLWTGITLYYGPHHAPVGLVLGGSNQYRLNDGTRIKALKIQYPDGRTGWKSREAVTTSPAWQCRPDEAAAHALDWEDFDE